MYITKLAIKNLGPIASISIKPRFLKNGSPVPIAIVGQNGSGKSLTLSVLLDALIESRRAVYDDLPEVEAGKYLRVSNKSYIKHDASYSVAEVIIGKRESEVIFREIVSNISFNEFASAEPELAQLLSGQEKFTEAGFYKDVTLTGSAKEAIKFANLLYFPYFRYERSPWISEFAKLDFVRDNFHLGQAKINPVRTSIIRETRLWILNLLLDRELYEKKLSAAIVADLQGKVSLAQVFGGYEGQSTNFHNMINEVLTDMLRAKDPKIEMARIGIGSRIGRNISVIVNKEGAETTVVQDLDMLSSGELMVLAIATEIIRSYEISNPSGAGSLSDITGIVLIDEADLHLHISFQNKVLPLIIRRFPMVQFILSTHSPLMVLGLHETGDLDVYDFPIGAQIEPSEFSEFRSIYDLFVKQNDQFRDRYIHLQDSIKSNNSPMIVTEGKTDWQILKDTLLRLKTRGEFEHLNVSFFEFDDSVDMGDVRLKQMCEAMAKLSNGRKIIFIFDRDNSKIIKEMSGAPSRYRSLDNNVYSFCLPVPPHRNQYENLTIELMYEDRDLMTRDPRTNKRLWFTNEINIVYEPGADEKKFIAQAIANPDTELKKKVFDQPADKIVDATGCLVGLSKSAFTSVIVLDHTVSINFNIDHFVDVFSLIEEITNA